MGDFGFDHVAEQFQFAGQQDDEVIKRDDAGESAVGIDCWNPSNTGVFHRSNDLKDAAPGIHRHEFLAHDVRRRKRGSILFAGDHFDCNIAIRHDAARYLVLDDDDAPDVRFGK